MTTISIRSTSVRDKIKRIILQQSKVGIQQLDSIRLLIKPYIASDDNLSFDRIKELIGFRLFRVAQHDENMTLCIQLLSAIIKNVILGNTYKHMEVVN
jgi:hypothetical protein